MKGRSIIEADGCRSRSSGTAMDHQVIQMDMKGFRKHLKLLLNPSGSRTWKMLISDDFNVCGFLASSGLASLARDRLDEKS
jgi:hypothetical protein